MTNDFGIEYENCAILRHNAASSGSFLLTFRDNLSVQFSVFMNLNSEDGTDRLSRNVGMKLPLCLRIAQFSSTSRRKQEITL